MSHYDSMQAAQARIVGDFRSDTVTRPCAGMLAAMAEAPLGDDVFGDDPTVAKLEAEVARLLGKQAALFLPTGTQSNLVAALSHCGRGEEIIVGRSYHLFADEAKGASVLGGIGFEPLETDARGALDHEAIAGAVQPDDPHQAISRLLALENTVSGSAIPLSHLQDCAAVARQHGLSVHLDGARLFNAAASLGCAVDDLAAVADSVSLCLSKGLGTPLGSVLAGDSALIARARRNRKMLGGGMRQVGLVAAAGLYALAHNVERLIDDQRKAERLAQGLARLPQSGKGAWLCHQATNMVFVTPPKGQAEALLRHLASAGLLAGGAPRLRLVMHKDIDEAAVTALGQAILDFANLQEA